MCACVTELPPNQWGMDVTFRTNVKLYIRHILEVSEHPASEMPGQVFTYRGHPIYKVDIMGIVVRIDEWERLTKYAVDDGSGVISCTSWKKNPGQQHDASWMDDLDPILSQKLKAVTKHSCIGIGDLVHVRGRIRVFRDCKEINATYIAKVLNPNEETARLLELPDLYRKFYNQPVQLRDPLAGGCGTFTAAQVGELRTALVKYFNEKHILAFRMNDLLSLAHLQDVVDAEHQKQDITDKMLHELLTHIIDLLCCDGIIYGSPSLQEYKVVRFDQSLRSSVLETLQTECQKSQYADMGCHYLHILDVLKKRLQFASLTRTSLYHCLSDLESCSEVISTSDNHFITFSS